MKRIHAILDSVFNLVLTTLLVIAGLYASYGLWDNHRIYGEAQNTQDSIRQYKPSFTGASFEDLLKINGDVKAWLTLDNTMIDHPIVQGNSNLSYFNTDVYGEFSLTGSIYLDSRNDDTFKDQYSLIYGHHMVNSLMFGDLDLYKDETFFQNNQTGTLILPHETYDLEIFATLLVKADEENIFNPLLWRDDIRELEQFILEHYLYLNQSVFDETFDSEDIQIISLTTCATEFNDARTIVLAVMNLNNE